MESQSQEIKNIAAALCKAVSKMPEIARNKSAKIRSNKGADSSYSYQYADYHEVLKSCLPSLFEHGLVPTFTREQAADGKSNMVGKLLHAESGEWLSASLPMPAHSTNQELGGNVSYLKRYLFGMLVPIAACEPDDDCQRADAGIENDENAQAAIFEAKKQAKEAELKAWREKKEAVGQVSKAEPVKDLAAAGLAPEQPKSSKPEPAAEPKHLADLRFMVQEAGHTVEDFMHWATHPRTAEGKKALLPDGSSWEKLNESFCKQIMGGWSKALESITANARK